MYETIGKLKCMRRPGDNDKQNVVLLHGFGASASDLFPLADFLDPDGEWNFYFPEAPLEVPIGPMNTGRAWFPISVRDLDAGLDIKYTRLRPPGMEASAALVYDLVFHLNSDQLILGGFSQGSMLATEVALENPQDVAGLVLLSGSLLDEENWKSKASRLKGKPLFQSHGTGDPVIPFAAAQKLYDILRVGGMEGSLISFGGGHDIPLPVLQRARQFVNGIFNPP